jgi:putative peptide zinc metalloprotease protein
MEDKIDIAEIKPIKDSELAIYPFGKEEYFIHHLINDRRVKITGEVKKIIELVDGEKKIKEIAIILNSNGLEIDVESLHRILYDNLAKYGIIKSDIEISENSTLDYLTFRIELFNKHIVAYITPIFSWLFQQKKFYFLSLIMITFNVFLFVYFFDKETIFNSLSPQAIFTISILTLFGVIFHEFGHASACREFKVEHGGIGFGLYMFRPVFYADVSDAWRLNKEKRIIINLAGIFMQLLLATFLGCVFLFYNNPLYLLLSYAVLTSSFINLNPLFRYDGYWVVSDLTNIPNLRSKSNTFFWDIFKTPKKQYNLMKDNKTNIFLFFYGFFSFSFLIFFLLYFVIFNTNSILYFPKNLFIFLSNIIVDLPKFNYDNNKKIFL